MSQSTRDQVVTLEVVTSNGPVVVVGHGQESVALDVLLDEWFVEHDGQRLVLDPEKVRKELIRLRTALAHIAAGSNDGGMLVSGDMMEIAEAALSAGSPARPVAARRASR